jgi:hypothetical protein
MLWRHWPLSGSLLPEVSVLFRGIGTFRGPDGPAVNSVANMPAVPRCQTCDGYVAHMCSALLLFHYYIPALYTVYIINKQLGTVIRRLIPCCQHACRRRVCAAILHAYGYEHAAVIQQLFQNIQHIYWNTHQAHVFNKILTIAGYA